MFCFCWPQCSALSGIKEYLNRIEDLKQRSPLFKKNMYVGLPEGKSCTLHSCIHALLCPHPSTVVVIYGQIKKFCMLFGKKKKCENWAARWVSGCTIWNHAWAVMPSQQKW